MFVVHYVKGAGNLHVIKLFAMPFDEISVLQYVLLNSLTTSKQTTKFKSANFQKILSPSNIILRIQRLDGKQCRCR